MSNWSKEDLNHFNDSEVMQELEKGIISTVNRVAILNDKIAQQVSGSGKITQDITEGTKKLKDFNQALDTTMQKLRNFADDEVSMEDEDLDDDSEEISSKAREEIINELKKMAHKAISQGQHKVAYDIERTIDELNEVEILCE